MDKFYNEPKTRTASLTPLNYGYNNMSTISIEKIQ